MYTWMRNLYLDGDDGGGGGAPPAPTGTPAAPAGTFTQEDVNAIAAREKDQGKRAAQEEIAKTLGVSIEEAKSILEEHKTRTDADKSEAQKAKDAADKARAEADSEKALAAQERQSVQVELALVRAGVTDEAKLARVVRLVDVEPGADAAAIDASVKVLQKEMPELFGAGGGGGGKPPVGDPPGKPPVGGPNGESSMAKGLKRGQEVSAGAAGSGPGGYDLPT